MDYKHHHQMSYVDREHQAAQYIIEDLAAKAEREARRRLRTKDGYEVDTWIYNSRDYSCHVFMCRKQGERVNSTNHDLYHLHGRDAYETLLKDCGDMTREDIVRMFFK